jgi:hypothetical protein
VTLDHLREIALIQISQAQRTNAMNNRPATPASFWTYQAGSATPSYAEALDCGAITSKMTEQGWDTLTPGMKREIVRSHMKRANA